MRAFEAASGNPITIGEVLNDLQKGEARASALLRRRSTNELN
jgi:hypothetical protein